MIDFIFIIFVFFLIFLGLIYFVRGIAYPDISKRINLPKKISYGILFLLLGMLFMIFAGFMFL